MPYPSYPDEYRQKFYEDGHYKSIYFVESMNNVQIVPGEDLKVNPVEDPLRPGNKTIVFTEAQLIREKFTYKEYLNSANNICVGSCECNSIEFTIRNNGVVPPLFYNTGTEQVERTFKVYVYFDHDSSTVIPLGMFRVTEDTLSGDKKERNITMYDYMATLRDLDAYDWYQNFKKAHPNGSTLKVFRDSFWDFMQNPDPTKGIKFPVTQKTQTLINDNVKIAYTLDEDTILLSAGNIIEDLCEINGVWGRFSRDVDSQNRSIFEYVEMPHITSKTKITKWRSIEPFQRDMYITHDWYQTKPIHAVTIRNAYDANIAQYASAELETRDNEGNVTGRFGNYAIYDNKFIDEIKSSADNTENDTDPEDDPIIYVTGFEYLKRVCKNVLSKIKYVKYTPYELTTVGDLARTCGDIIYVNGTGEDDVIEELQDYTHFFSYVFERELKGIQNMRDTYRAKGDRVLPMFGDSSTSSGYTSSGGGGAYAVQSSGITGGTGIAENVNTTGKADGVPLEYWPELIRNVGLRVPDSPKGKVVFDKATGAATITWTDPADYDDNKPIPSVWEKTYLLRSYKGRPWNIYDPSIEVLVTETVKDTYKTNGFVDSTAGQHDKVFYAIFPQNTAGYVNPFTVLSIKPDRTMEAPEITDVKNPTPHSVTVDHTIPDQTSTYSKKVVVANPDHEPLDATDGIATVITNFASTVVSGLEQNRDYYFKVFLVKASGAESESDYDEGKTTEDPYWHIINSIPKENASGWMDEVTGLDYDEYHNVRFGPDYLYVDYSLNPGYGSDARMRNLSYYYERQEVQQSSSNRVYIEVDFWIKEGEYASISNMSVDIGGNFYWYLNADSAGLTNELFINGYNWRGTTQETVYYPRLDDKYRGGIINYYNDGEWHTAKLEIREGWEDPVAEWIYYYIDDDLICSKEVSNYLFPPFTPKWIVGQHYGEHGDIITMLNPGSSYDNDHLDYVRWRLPRVYTNVKNPNLDVPIPKLWNIGTETTQNETTMSYSITDFAYDQTKLVLKIGSAPTSITDGQAIDVHATSGETERVVVQNLTPGTEYYAVIFVTQGTYQRMSWNGKPVIFSTLPEDIETPLYTFGGTYDGWFEDSATGLYMTTTPGGSGDGAYTVSAEGTVRAVDGSKYGLINFATRNGSSIVYPYNPIPYTNDLIYRIEIRRRVGVDPSTQYNMFYTVLDSEGSTIREQLQIGTNDYTPRWTESMWGSYTLTASGTYDRYNPEPLIPTWTSPLIPEDGLWHTAELRLIVNSLGQLISLKNTQIWVDGAMLQEYTSSYHWTLSLGLPYSNIDTSLNGPHYPSRIVINKGWELKSFKVLYKRHTS